LQVKIQPQTPLFSDHTGQTFEYGVPSDGTGFMQICQSHSEQNRRTCNGTQKDIMTQHCDIPYVTLKVN